MFIVTHIIAKFMDNSIKAWELLQREFVFIML